MHKERFDCSKMTDNAVQERIRSYVECGWEFNGYIDFPPPHLWACFTWNKESEPIYPSSKT